MIKTCQRCGYAIFSNDGACEHCPTESARPLVSLVGGPLDGIEVPNDGYFEEGDIEAVNTLAFCIPGSQWSPESVYRMTGGKLVYDQAATAERAKIVANSSLIEPAS